VAAQRILSAWLALPLLTAVAVSAPASGIPSAYQVIARQAGVPPAVLYALALTESAVRLPQGYRPWPWTLNIAGKSHYFRNQQAACAAIHQAVAQHGAKRVDVGLGQINLGWHGALFQRPCEALQPHRNLRKAAELLREQFEQTNDWLAAAARYHRPAGGAPAVRYQKRFARQLARLMQVSESTLPAVLAQPVALKTMEPTP